MSNFLVIATVTATLGQVLRNVVRNDVNGAEVTSVDPANSNGLPPTRVNVYLYQVLPNAALRNADLPTRRDDGSLMQRPNVALDLYYLLTFFGDDSRLEPQRMLGSVVSHCRHIPCSQGMKLSAPLAILASTFWLDQTWGCFGDGKIHTVDALHG